MHEAYPTGRVCSLTGAPLVEGGYMKESDRAGLGVTVDIRKFREPIHVI